jgi:DNA-binding MarR family transcriptional regulator
MNQSLNEFRTLYLDKLLSFLWRQWFALGVAGYGDTEDNRVIDPEALLLFTFSIGRYDARLFDEVLDWLNTNGDFINIQRLKMIIRQEQFIGQSILPAVAELISQRHNTLKWKGLIENTKQINSKESLFFLKDGKPMEQYGAPEPIFSKHGFNRGEIELKGKTQPVRTMHTTGLLFKLRALFGINARSEIILYLVTHDAAHPSLIAREIYYSQKTVQDTLVDMVKSGLILIRPVGREKQYRLKTEDWVNFLGYKGERLQWVNWALLLKALEEIWLKLNQKELTGLNPIAQSSELRVLMQSVRAKIESAGFAGALSDDKLYLGESYTGIFLADIKNLLLNLSAGGD